MSEASRGFENGSANMANHFLERPLLQQPPLVAPEPAHCPGPETASAGKSSACEGCPNQSICASTPKGPDPDVAIITERLARVRHKVLVLSGKGGVGKSTLTALLGRAFATQTGTEVDTIGIMDTDICGPSMPKMFGVEAESVHVSSAGWSPVWVTDNLALMSVQFLLPGQDEAVIWRGAKKTGLIKQFLKDVEWGSLDYLFVDTPPGTSDEHLSVNALLQHSGLDGAVLVSTPQETSLLDVRKEIDFCNKAGIRILGIVENMAGYVCGNCQHVNQVFKPTTGGVARLAHDCHIAFLGAVPLDPRIGMAADYGEDFIEAFPDNPAGQGILNVVANVKARLRS